MDFKKIKAVIFDFDGVFTDNFVYTNENGFESVKCYRSDGIGLSMLKNIGIKLAIISTEKNGVVKVRAAKLDIECMNGVEDKDAALKVWSHRNNISLENIAFIGNDINDISALKIVGYPIGVADSFDEILPYIKLKLSKKGGQGAVREFCEILIKNL
jgi:YrbI family 3-deoxy-D-manno-octulosonate 8-phosphate phosphatase